jgi:hypothetical protein
MSSLSRSSSFMTNQKYRSDAAASGPLMAPYLSDVDVRRWTSSKCGVDAAFTTVHIVPYPSRPCTPLSVRVRVSPTTKPVIPLTRSNSNPAPSSYIGPKRRVPDHHVRKPLPKLPLPQLPDPFESPASDVTRLDFDSPEPVVTRLPLPRRPHVVESPASTMVRLGTNESPIPIAARLAYEPFDFKASPASLARGTIVKQKSTVILKNQTKDKATTTTTTPAPRIKVVTPARSTLAPPQAPALKSRWSEYSTPKAARSTEEFPMRSDSDASSRAVMRRRGTISNVGKFVKHTFWCSTEKQ